MGVFKLENHAIEKYRNPDFTSFKVEREQCSYLVGKFQKCKEVNETGALASSSIKSLTLKLL